MQQLQGARDHSLTITAQNRQPDAHLLKVGLEYLGVELVEHNLGSGLAEERRPRGHKVLAELGNLLAAEPVLADQHQQL